MARLEEEDLVEGLETPDAAKIDHLKLVHTDEYVEMVSNFGEGYLDPDTYNREETFDIALLAAGGGILAARRAWAKRKPTIALPRPPGHHAAGLRRADIPMRSKMSFHSRRYSRKSGLRESLTRGATAYPR